MLQRISIVVAAGAIGGLATVLAMWASAQLGLRPVNITNGLIYKQFSWGGLWGLVFLLPILSNSWWQRGLVLGLLPALAVCFYFLPLRGIELFGSNFTIKMLLFVVLYNVIVWGLVTSFWIKRARK